MGLFSFLGGGSPEEREAKKIRDLVKRSQEKYGDPATRSRALEGLRDIGSPKAIAALIGRFNVKTEPSITDREEKDYTLELVTGLGRDAVDPLIDFIRRNDNVAWAVRCLEKLVPEEELVGNLVGLIDKIAAEYSRDPEKKIVLVNRLAEVRDPRIVDAILPLLQDSSDEVRAATLTNLVAQGEARATTPIAECLISAESPRVRAASAAALAELGAPVDEGLREELAKKLPADHQLGGDGVVKRK